MGERQLCKLDVVGSSPIGSTRKPLNSKYLRQKIYLKYNI